MYSIESATSFSTDTLDPTPTTTFLLPVTLTGMNDIAPTGTRISSPSLASLNALIASEAMVTSSSETRRTWT